MVVIHKFENESSVWYSIFYNNRMICNYTNEIQSIIDACKKDNVSYKIVQGN